MWKTILPIGSKRNQFSKWSPNWKGPYKVIKVIFGNSYMLETLQGERLTRAINGRYLKKYFLSVWQEAFVLSKQWPIHVSPLEQKWSMYTSPLVAEQPMRGVSSLFGFI